MANDPTDPSELSDDERRRLEAERRRGGASLDEEIVRRWSPERLRKLVVDGAGRGEKLDLTTRSEMDKLLPGQDFSDVRVFRGPLAEEVTRRHGADAVTVGKTGMILVRESSRSAPGTAAGKALLAHELTHVAQARQGMVFAKEGGGEGDHEKEAEAVEARAHEPVGGGDARASGSGAIERQHEMRRKVTERAIELLREQMSTQRQRSGR